MDWKDITPLTEYEAKEVVKKYLARGGFTANEIDTKNQPEGLNIPDLEVSEGSRIASYGEVKTPNHILNPVTGMYMWNTTINKLRALSKKAIKQLETYEPSYEHPRVIVFTSDHPQLNWTNCVHHIQGAVSYNKEIVKDFRNRETGWDLANDLRKIEMIIWLQVNYLTRKDIAEATHLINKGSHLIIEVNRISQALPTGYRP